MPKKKRMRVREEEREKRRVREEESERRRRPYLLNNIGYLIITRPALLI